MILESPVALIVYKRLDTTRRVFEKIKEARPPRLYIIADGPKSKEDIPKCQAVRKIFDDAIDWNCQVYKIYSKTNLGLAKRVQTGLDFVFKEEQKAIILEDDTLPDSSFFSFCDELLLKYEQNENVAHISGCNLHPDAFKQNASYCFSSIVNVWGWATWKRSWNHFDLKMKGWADESKDDFLKKWCVTRAQAKGSREIFDQHCMNDDPWAWSYAWVYACWANDALSIIPKVNLVSNIGFGPDATNTTIADYNLIGIPETRGKINSICHPDAINRDLVYEKKAYHLERGTITRRIKQFIKRILKI